MTTSPTGWTKASASTGNGQCLELRALPSGRIAVRDSKNPDGVALVFTREEITAWLAGAKAGEFDEFADDGAADGVCELPHMSVEEEDACERRHYARGGVVTADVLAGFDMGGCTYTLPPRADIEAQAGRFQLRRRTPEESRAYLETHRGEQIAKGVPAEVIDALIEATHDSQETS